MWFIFLLSSLSRSKTKIESYGLKERLFVNGTVQHVSFSFRLLQVKKAKWELTAEAFSLSPGAYRNLELLAEISLLECNALVRSLVSQTR